jgi:hypothetical protein
MVDSVIYDEYVGLTQHVSGLVERHRSSPLETKCDILARILANIPLQPPTTPPQNRQTIDLGQGVQAFVGETLYLFLHKRQSEPDATADVRADGIYIYGEKVTPSKGSLIHPAMKRAQRHLRHLNSQGQLVSLSAYRQWYAERNGKLVKLDDLKDPNKARKRFTRPLSSADLGISI